MKIIYKIYDCPAKWLPESKVRKLQNEITELATQCLDELPNYQCLRNDLRDMDRLIICTAKTADGKLIGFTSSYLLEVYGETVLHLGLTCVSPEARGLRLTHKLSSKVIQKFLWTYSLTKSSWVSNVACVLSSLGNVASYFDQVYPSPFAYSPSPKQVEIALYISQTYREELYIRPQAQFDSKNFLFKESVLGNMFQKELGDARFHHRNPMLNQFYRSLIDFESGDEVLQIAKVSWMTFPKYVFKKMIRKFKKSKTFASPDLLGIPIE